MTRSSNRPICGSQQNNLTRNIKILLQHGDIAISARISTLVTLRSDWSLLKVLQPFIHGYQLAKNYYCANFDCFPGVILFQLDKLLARSVLTPETIRFTALSKVRGHKNFLFLYRNHDRKNNTQLVWELRRSEIFLEHGLKYFSVSYAA